MNLNMLIFVIVFIVGAAVISAVSRMYAKRRRLAALAASLGKPPENTDCEIPSIMRYARHMDGEKQRVDGITWNDLEMDKVFKRVNTCLTSVGEEYLYNCLHEIPLSSDGLLRREKLIEFFAENESERLAAQMCLAGVSKENYNGLSAMIFHGDAKLLGKPFVYKILAAMPFIMAGVLFLNVHIGVFAILASFTANLIIYYRTKNLVDIEIPTIGYLSRVLQGLKNMTGIKKMDALPIMDDIKKAYSIFKPVIRKAPAANSVGGEAADILFMYFNILFLYDIRKYNRFIKLIIGRKEELHKLYRTFGEVDLALCVLSFRMSLPVYSLPEFHGENALEFTDIYHPLIESPVMNSCRIAEPSLLTGSNASGKSTFIKAMAVNGILAQTLNTAAARAFKMRFSMILTSMAMRDDISGGDSYFIVEIKSLKRILVQLNEFPCAVFIDEILRGTNTIERIAAAASVLAHLRARDCLCVAASHDIELTHILHNFTNYHFREQVTNDGIVFDYLLKEGPSTTRNALKLLEYMNFGTEIVEKAGELARGYERDKVWQLH